MRYQGREEDFILFYFFLKSKVQFRKGLEVFQLYISFRAFIKKQLYILKAHASKHT